MTDVHGAASDFYEDDEPAERIQDAFDSGEKYVTKRPRDLNQLAKALVDEATDPAGSFPAPAGVSGVTVQSLRLETGVIRGDAPCEVVVSR